MRPFKKRLALTAMLPFAIAVLPASAQAALLTYTLSAPLKEAGCNGDRDNDCLNDAIENELAWLASPQYFLDEEENCAAAWYLNNGSMTGSYGRVDLVQVRPSEVVFEVPFSLKTMDIADWEPNSRRAYMLTIVYVFGHFYDCHSAHLGDNENVVYEFFSSDLKTWNLANSTYYAHGTASVFSGEYLAARAAEIGSPYASVAADEDGHGSWPGRSGGSSECADNEDDCGSWWNLWLTCTVKARDCFYDSSMKASFTRGHFEWMDTSRNIGEPFSGWNSNALWVWGDYAQLTLDTAYGSTTEIMSSAPPWDKFCGFSCSQRANDGNCAYQVHGDTDCSSPMFSKWSTNPFNVFGVRHGG